jgi:hypothetical protein
MKIPLIVVQDQQSTSDILGSGALHFARTAVLALIFVFCSEGHARQAKFDQESAGLTCGGSIHGGGGWNGFADFVCSFLVSCVSFLSSSVHLVTYLPAFTRITIYLSHTYSWGLVSVLYVYFFITEEMLYVCTTSTHIDKVCGQGGCRMLCSRCAGASGARREMDQSRGSLVFGGHCSTFLGVVAAIVTSSGSVLTSGDR